MSRYRVDFSVDDADPLQATLNRLYGYERDVTTKVLHRARLNLFALLLEELSPPRGAALDVGCSAGAYARILKDAAFDPVLGLDPDDDAVAAGRQAFPDLDLRVGRVEELADDARYALVLCTEVLEHVEDPNAAVAAMERALVPGGVLVVSLPNAFSLPYLAMRLAAGGGDRELREHLRYPFWRTLRLLERPHLTRIATAGSNLVLEPKLIRALVARRLFPAVNRLNFRLARAWPLRYAAQFFFVAARKGCHAAHRADAGASRSPRA